MNKHWLELHPNDSPRKVTEPQMITHNKHFVYVDYCIIKKDLLLAVASR